MKLVLRQALGSGMLCCAAFAAMADEVKVAVAANFTDVTQKLAPLFEQQTGHTLRASFGSSGKLYAQIEHGAPFAVFLSADAERPARAEAAGLAVTGSRFTYAYGKVVLWSATPGRVDDQGAVLKEGKFARLAIANPKTAPYGAAAEQVMAKLGVLMALKPKLVQGDSIAQTMQFALSGNAELGFVALSQVQGLAPEQAGSRWVVPQDLYEPIAQQAVLLQKGADSVAARAFLQFLRSAAAKTVIQRYGYATE